MNIGHPYHWFPIILSALLSPVLSIADGGRGHLNLDGILVLKGPGALQARVVVIPADAPAMVLENVSGRFSLVLLLDNNYLLSFERDGYVTKQIYFDTSVPVERVGDELDFPFKVTLYPEGNDGIYAYAGPVGVVTYHTELADFGYMTDYTLRPGAPMVDRMTALMARTTAYGGDLRDAQVKVALPAEGLRIDERIDQMATRASRVGETGPLVHKIIYKRPQTTGTKEVVVSMPLAPPPPPLSLPRNVMVREVATLVERDEPLSTPPTLPVKAEAELSPGRPHHVVERPTPPAPWRDEQLVVEKKRVITIVRIEERTGVLTEYRRVADSYGAVYYFRDGMNIPESLYRASTGR